MTLLLTAPSVVSSRPRPLPRGRWLSWTIVFALFLSAALVGIETWQMWHVRDASLRSAAIVSASLAESLSQQIETTFKTADTVVGSLVQRVETDGVNPDSMQRLYGTMTSLAAALPAIHEMGLIDKDGNALVKSLVPHPAGMNYSERDYFRHFKSRNAGEVFVGRPVRSKVDGTLNITVSRGVNDRNGGFNGVVVTSVSMDFFRKLFQSVRDHSGRSIAMLSDDGVLLAASPSLFGDGELAALNASRDIEYRSPVDGLDRVGSAKRLAHYPMTVLVSEDSSAILHDWYNQLRVHGAIVLCILAVIGVLGYRVDQANRAARLQALRDGLTGLANRRCFDHTIDRELRRAARSGKSLALIMMDIDRFKEFNDRYGHPAGDACLCAVSDAVQDTLRRPADMAARYGGEEIAVLLPETDSAGAVHIVEEMRAAVQALAIRHEASPQGVVTLSAGVACWRPGQPSTAAWLVEMSDTALYAAKANGRNNFIVHPSAAAPGPVARDRAA
ncbi:MAG TPA: diguanylate cyclase [Pseudolabrys sp.]|nr:diguanylate cyclase [Pseudolabrys sp.]